MSSVSSSAEGQTPLVSVMIGVYNGAKYLGAAIESILKQTYRPFELIVVDDGSDDGSAEVAQGFGEVVTYAYQENAGNGSARNHATRLARGDIFAFMDADDLSSPDRLSLQWDALAADPDLDAVFGHAREFVSPELSETEQATVRPPTAGVAPWVSVNLMMTRRKAFDKVGPFSESLKVGVTVDWCARAVDAGLKTVVLPQVILDRRLHLTNNGIRERESKAQYVQVVKAALDRRRAREQSGE